MNRQPEAGSTGDGRSRWRRICLFFCSSRRRHTRSLCDWSSDVCSSDLLDLALALIRRASPELASLTARYLVVDERASQSIYSIPDHLAHADPLIRHFERWARGRLAEGFSLDQAAEDLATSKRTLARRMQSVLGKSPLAYFQDLRIERAVHLLRTSHASVDQIGAEVGYAEGVTLRALPRRRLGRGVREIRRSL